MEFEGRIARMQAELLGLQQQLNSARSGQPAVHQVLPSQPGIISELWQSFRSAVAAGFSVVSQGWQKLKSWATTAWQVTKLVAGVVWAVAKVGAFVAWGVTKMVARRVWNKVKGFSLRVWTAVKPKLETAWANTKSVLAQLWMVTAMVSIVVFEKAIAIAAWLSRRMQQTVEVASQAINQVAEYLGRMVAHVLVLGIWAVLQFRTVYEVARDTVREELYYAPEEQRMAA